MNRLALWSCLLLTAAMSFVEVGWAETPSASNHDGNQEADTAAHVSVRLPFHLHWGYLVIVEGSIGSSQKLNFLVDTGAYSSVIDQKIAIRLGLAAQPARVNLSNKSVQTRQVVLPSILLGPIHAESLPVLTEDLSFLQKALGRKVDGIVGLDVLRKSSFSINYRTKEMLFGPVGDMTFSAPFETETPVVCVGMGFQDRKLRLVVDSAEYPHPSACRNSEQRQFLTWVDRFNAGRYGLPR
jgi:hypothetical protein